MIPVPGTEFLIRPLVLGANVFGWTADESSSFAVLDAFTDAGGSFIDTADGYSWWVPGHQGGESEEIIGRWLAHSGRRGDVQLATKVATHPQFKGLAPANITAAAEASLSRLGTDYIDLYYAHYDDATQRIEDMAVAFDALVGAGKVRYVALSNFSVERERAWLDFAKAEGLAVPVALQPHYNLLHRGDVESGYGPLAQEYGLAVFPYFSLAAGLLSGKYHAAAELAGNARSAHMNSYLKDGALTAEVFQVIDTAREVGAAHGVSVASVALAWMLAKPFITAPIASARTPQQLIDLLAATELTLEATEVAALDAVSAPFC